MESLCALPRTHVPRHRARALSMHGFWLIAAASVSFAASATTASHPPRFQLAGAGTLQLDPPVRKSVNVQLKAYLTPNDAAISASPPVQEGGGFALMANLAATSLICYNDTIFLDDFDGDGF